MYVIRLSKREIVGSLSSELNSLLVRALMNTGRLVAGESYDLDFDHQFIETEKYDAKMTYKKTDQLGL